MASAQQVTEQHSNYNPGELIGQIVDFFSKPIFLVALIGLVLLIGMILIFVKIMIKDEKLREERDHAYKKSKDIKKACSNTQIKGWVKQSWSPMNLLFLPFFIFPAFLPIIKKEESFKVYDYQRQTFLGYYRGHTYEHGELIFQLYKTKDFFIFENRFLLRTMQSHKYELHKTNEKGEIEYEIKGKKHVPITIVKEETNFKKLHRYGGTNNKDPRMTDYTWLEIQCDGIRIQNEYYFVPNYFIIEDGERVIKDFRAEYHENIKNMLTDKIIDNVLVNSGKIIDEVARSNPDNAKARHSTEKVESDKSGVDNNE